MIPPLHKAQYEIECDNPELIMNAVDFRDDKDKLTVYEVKNNKLVITFEASSIDQLIKNTYAVCNKIKLPISTMKEFSKK